MKAKRSGPVRGEARTRTPRQPVRGSARRAVEAAPRRGRPVRDPRSAPTTSPLPRPTGGPTGAPARPKSATQAKARAKARKAKAPKVVRPPLRERLILRLASVELNPRALLARVPFVVLVIGSLGLGLGITLWLSTGSAERSYQLGAARETNQTLLQQKEALERDVLEAQAAPALAESARKLGMIPSRDTAHLVQDPSGNWVVVGKPKPAEGVPPPPLNTPIQDAPPPPPPPPPAPKVLDPREVPVRMPTGLLGAPMAGVPTVPGSVPAVPGAPLAVPLTSGALPGAPAPIPAPGAPAPVGAPAPIPAPGAPAPVAAPAPIAPPPAPVVPGPEHLPAAGAPVAPGPPALGEQFSAPAAGAAR